MAQANTAEEFRTALINQLNDKVFLAQRQAAFHRRAQNFADGEAQVVILQSKIVEQDKLADYLQDVVASVIDVPLPE